MEYNKVWDFFDEIWCINLDHRKDRWTKAQMEFDSVGLLQRVNRFSAIKEEDGRLGVIKSNLQLIKMAKEKNLKNILIFEDDVHFINNPIETLDNSLNQIGTIKWSLIYLGANTHEKLELITRTKPNILQLKNAFAAHSICYNNNTFDIFIKKYENIEKVEWIDILDVWLAQSIQKRNLCLVINPIITTQSESYSDIEKRDVNYNFIEERFKTNTDYLKLNI